MRVLVTGGRGLIGDVVVDGLRAAGEEPVVFDAGEGYEIRDLDQLREVGGGCEAIVHLAAIPNDTEQPEELMSINVLGTWQALRLAVELGHRRFVMASSAQATGVFYRRRDPDYLPLDDSHPAYPSTPYAQSKLLAETLCESVTRVHGMATVCLRPPLVVTDETLAELRDQEIDETDEAWNLGSWVHAEDVAAAVVAALRCPDPGHAVLLLSAEDTWSSRPTRELLDAVYPQVPWRGPDLDSADRHLSLIDASGARRVLGWTPRRRFPRKD